MKPEFDFETPVVQRDFEPKIAAHGEKGSQKDPEKQEFQNRTQVMKHKMVLSYDGTPYVGWQVQPNGTSIQGCLERALATLLKEEVKVVGSGRTDAGVHALGQVAHFRSERAPLIKSLNGL